MKIGIIGLGKLGYPVALAIKDKGHEVFGFDVNEDTMKMIRDRRIAYQEAGAEELIKKHEISLMPMSFIVDNSDIIFLAIQTPHEERYEGVTPIPEERADFDYSYLKKAVADLAEEASLRKTKITVVIISTVLPGTIEREIKPLLGEYVDLCYNPFFIAMGTVIADFVNPEFVLLGVESEEASAKVKEFYATIHSKPIAEMPIIDAELTKVAYNTFIGMKIVFVNTLMEICEKNGGNVDNVTDALKLATDRLISPKYLTAGMGDGGGCHPRDNIAMSYLAKKLDLSHNLFEDIMKAREDQTRWLAKIIEKAHRETGLDVVILGREFKPETNLDTGSPSRLLSNILGMPHFLGERGCEIPESPRVFFIGTKHPEYAEVKFPKGSTVIDPFRYIQEQSGVYIISLGNSHE